MFSESSCSVLFSCKMRKFVTQQPCWDQLRKYQAPPTSRSTANRNALSLKWPVIGQSLPSRARFFKAWKQSHEEVQKSSFLSEHLNYNMLKGYYGIFAQLSIFVWPQSCLWLCLDTCLLFMLILSNIEPTEWSLPWQPGPVGTVYLCLFWQMFSNNMWDQKWFSVYDTLSGLQPWFHRDMQHPPVPLFSTPKSNEDPQTGDKWKGGQTLQRQMLSYRSQGVIYLIWWVCKLCEWYAMACTVNKSQPYGTF